MEEQSLQRIEKEIEIVNELGLHARPAAMFVQTANKFSSEIKISRDSEIVNGKSIMGVMMLAAAKGTKVKIVAEGEDAQQAAEELEKLFLNKFGEE
jgi:phosphocarrier protein HPr